MFTQLCFVSYIFFVPIHLLDERKTSKRFGVIECDPLVRQGLDRTVSHQNTVFPLSCSLSLVSSLCIDNCLLDCRLDIWLSLTCPCWCLHSTGKGKVATLLINLILDGED